MEKKFDKNTSMALKGIAIIMMICHHSFVSLKKIKQYSVFFWPLGIAKAVKICKMGKICVSFFAFISGYGLYKSYKNKKVSGLKWVLSREIKILGGFWIIAILAMIICQIADGRTAAVYFSDNTIKDGIGYMIIDLLGLAGTLHTPTLCSTWWYMSAAVIYVALVPLLVKLENKLYLVFLVAMILPRVINQYVLAKSNAISFFFSIFTWNDYVQV
jgi:peptidoglycan/LPS O-acetylase OafA/YrhL